MRLATANRHRRCIERRERLRRDLARIVVIPTGEYRYLRFPEDDTTRWDGATSDAIDPEAMTRAVRTVRDGAAADRLTTKHPAGEAGRRRT